MQRLIDYILLKDYLSHYKIELNKSPEEIYNITYQDYQNIIRLFNITPKLAPNFRIYPSNTKPNKKCQNNTFHTPQLKSNEKRLLINYYMGLNILNYYNIDHTKKSFGYNQPTNSFNYVDDDFQQYTHNVMYFPRGGDSSRINNKENHNLKSFI
jgi:hypothetical protein